MHRELSLLRDLVFTPPENEAEHDEILSTVARIPSEVWRDSVIRDYAAAHFTDKPDLQRNVAHRRAIEQATETYVLFGLASASWDTRSDLWARKAIDLKLKLMDPKLSVHHAWVLGDRPYNETYAYWVGQAATSWVGLSGDSTLRGVSPSGDKDPLPPSWSEWVISFGSTRAEGRFTLSVKIGRAHV